MQQQHLHRKRKTGYKSLQIKQLKYFPIQQQALVHTDSSNQCLIIKKRKASIPLFLQKILQKAVSAMCQAAGHCSFQPWFTGHPDQGSSQSSLLTYQHSQPFPFFPVGITMGRALSQHRICTCTLRQQPISNCRSHVMAAVRKILLHMAFQSFFLYSVGS